MVDFHDRRQEDLYTVITPGYKEQDEWSGQPVTPQSKKVVHDYYSRQQSSPEWADANRLAKRRANRRPQQDLSQYANEYLGHLARVIAVRGQELVAKHHPGNPNQSGYGRV